jgi:V/A-type H+-transporting ATPase subunit I
MQKVRLLVHSTDVDAALDIIQRAGALEFRATQMPDTTETELHFPHEQLLPRVQHAARFLAPYAPEVGFWRTLRDGSRIPVTEEQITRQLTDTDVVESVVDDLERLQVEFAEAEEKKRLLQEQYDLLLEWKALPIRLRDLKTARTVTLLVKGHQATADHSLEKTIVTLCTEQNIPFLITAVSSKTVAVTLINDAQLLAVIKTIVDTVDAELVTPPEGSELPEIEFVAVGERLAKAKGELGLLIDQAEHIAITHLKALHVAIDVLLWQRDRYGVMKQAAATHFSIVLDGWLMADQHATIMAEFKAKGLAASMAHMPLEEGEEPPVEIRNSSILQPFEAVTRLYGMPGYKDLDPTAFLAGFFFLFFGLCLTDVGYGLALVVAAGFILLFTKVTKATRSFAKLLLYIGGATVIVGAIFGGYFGVDPSLLPEPLQKIQLFDPIGNPLPVFYLALALGVLQTMVGLMLKIYSDARNGQLLAGIFDQGPWLFTFTAGILHLLTSLSLTDVLSTEQTKNLLLVGVVLIVVGSGRKGEGLFGKFISAAAGLYAGVAYFSDILSYSRLLALGLATSALAFAVNLIATMVVEIPYVGYIFAGVILLIGHLFTLVINTLGSFVHSARLQFVEFFGKFIAGSGKEFTPLTRKKQYVTIGDD